MVSRRQFLAGGAAVTAAAAFSGFRMPRAAALPRAASALPNPADAPFDHVIVLMFENRSFDHILGWLPGSDGRQAGLAFTDTSGTTYPTYPLAPDFQGCGYADPDHSWEGGAKQLNGGALDGFLQTAKPGDTFPIGYYEEASVPLLGALARNYTTLDRYFCSILAETFPNRMYMHAARTDRDHNQGITQSPAGALTTIWDRLAAANLTGNYYFVDEPFIGLFGPKYVPIMKLFPEFLADCAAGTLPNVAFVDPAFAGEDQGTSGDYHPHGDIRAGESFLSQIYEAVRSSPKWDRTILVINFDEWGGFFDHVVPPIVPDDTTNVALDPDPSKPHPHYGQLGFRVPCIVVSPFSHARVEHAGPYEHTSILNMIEWRWGLDPLTVRDANARNLAEVLDFSLARTDVPDVPKETLMPSAACGPQSTPARPPAALAGIGSQVGAPNPSSGSSGTGDPAGTGTQTGSGALPRTGGGVAVGAAAVATAAALAGRRLTREADVGDT